MICENCGKDSNSGIVYKKHIFCSHKCRDEFYKKLKNEKYEKIDKEQEKEKIS